MLPELRVPPENPGSDNSRGRHRGTLDGDLVVGVILGLHDEVVILVGILERFIKLGGCGGRGLRVD